MIGSVFVMVTAESTFLIGATTGAVRLFFLLTLFPFYLFPVLLSTADTVSYSEGLGVLRFLGANRMTITKAVAASILEAGLIGAVGGVALALLVSRPVSTLLASPTLTELLPLMGFVFASCAAGIAAGAALGVRFSWKNSI